MVDIFRKKRREKTLFAILICMFATILLCLMIITIAYFSKNNTASGQITLGELDFCLYENNLSFQNIVPACNISKTVTITNSRDNAGQNTSNLCSILFRFWIDAKVDGVKDSTLASQIELIFNSQSAYTNQNNIFYYNGVLNPGQNTNLCDAINFAETIDNNYQNKSVQIDFNIDAIQAENNAYLDIWQDAPEIWIDNISSALI